MSKFDDEMLAHVNELLNAARRDKIADIELAPDRCAEYNNLAVDFDIPLDLAKAIIMSTNIAASTVMKAVVTDYTVGGELAVRVYLTTWILVGRTLNIPEERMYSILRQVLTAALIQSEKIAIQVMLMMKKGQL